MDWTIISRELAKKLDPVHVKPAQKYGPKGDYIEGWHAIAEANRIFGFGNWSYTITDMACVCDAARPIGKDGKPGYGVTYTARVRVTAGDVVREDVGAGHGYDADRGLAHESAIKEAATDALKRALRSFGYPFGLALYDRTREHVGSTFDAEATADAVIATIKAATDMAALHSVWVAAKARIASVKAASPVDYARIEHAKNARKLDLEHEDIGHDDAGQEEIEE